MELFRRAGIASGGHTLNRAWSLLVVGIAWQRWRSSSNGTAVGYRLARLIRPAIFPVFEEWWFRLPLEREKLLLIISGR